jgi:flagellar biosynthesis protein FlhG
MTDQNKQQSNSHDVSEKDVPDTTSTAIAIAITSGKGGVGKTNISTNLGIALSRLGAKVCVFDADTSLANINILLGLTPEHTLEHYLNDDLAINDILVEGPENLKIVPSASGISEYANLDADKQAKLADALETLEQQFDYILIDTAAGIGEGVINFIQSAQYAIIVISSEPTSLTDAFSLVKVLKRRKYSHPIYILVNMINNYTHSMEVFKRFAQAVNKYIQLKVRYLGYIPMDKAVRDAVAAQTPIAVSQPESPAGRCIFLLANILLKHFRANNAPVRKISQFWREQYEKNTFAAPPRKYRVITDVSVSNGNATGSPLPEQATTDQDIQADDAAGPLAGKANLLSEAATLDNIDPYELIANLIHEEKLSPDLTESLVALLLSYYRMQFATIPKNVLDLVIQAHQQGELSDEVLTQLKTDHTDENINTPNQRTSIEKINLPSSGLGQVFSRVDELVIDAEHTKKELTALAEHIQAKYRELYNRNLPTSPFSTRSIKQPVVQERSSSASNSLRKSIYFASSVKKRKADS